MQKINSIVESDDAAIMMCKCGEELVFCKHPTCMITDCENCDFQQEVDFKFCEYESDSDHQCRRHQARGPFCKHHAGKYLVTCKDCGMTACELAKCEECGAHFCLEHLDEEEQLCENCRYELKDKLLECGVELDSDSDHDLFY